MEDGYKCVSKPRCELCLLLARTAKEADWAMAPVWSRSSTSRLVPAGSTTFHVNEVPVKSLQEKRAGEVGLSPGTMLYTEERKTD